MYNSIYTSDFIRTLQKINKRIFIKDEQTASPLYSEYKNTGLFISDANGDHKFIMAIPRVWIPEYSLAIAPLERLEHYEPEEYYKVMNTGFCKRERILYRGWRIILSSLISSGYIDRHKTEKLFKFRYEFKSQYPRNYINGEVI